MRHFLIFPILFILIGFSFASAQYQGDIEYYHLPVHTEYESYSIVVQSIITKFTKALYDEPAKALIFSISSDEQLIDTMAITMNNQTFLKLFSNIESEDPNDIFLLVNGEEIPYEAVTNPDTISWVFMVPPKSTEIELIGFPFWDSQHSSKPKLLIDMSNFIQIYSPLKQAHLDIPLENIQCKEDLVLIHKYDGSPACVAFKTKEKLIHRGWAMGETSNFQEILEQLRQGSQEVSFEHAELIKSLVILDPVVSEFLKDTTWDYSCCGYLSVGENNPNYKLVIKFFDHDDKKQLAVVFDLETLQIEKRDYGNMAKFQPFVGEDNTKP